MALPERQTAPIADRLSLALLAIAAVVALATFRDYGLGWDDYTHAEYGDLLLSLYASGFADRRALSFVNLYEYGGGFDLAAALLAKVLPFSVFETRRLTGAIVGLLGLVIVWRTGRRVGGPLAGFIALALLATCPLYVGHAFINAKDAPFAVAMAFLLLGLVRAFEEYPRPGAATVALVGLGVGLAIGTRILGGFGALYALGALVVDRHARGAPRRPACGGRVVRPLRAAAVAGIAARLCGDGAGMALGRGRAAQSVSRAAIFLALLRGAMGRVVRRRADQGHRRCRAAICRRCWR